MGVVDTFQQKLLQKMDGEILEVQELLQQTICKNACTAEVQNTIEALRDELARKRLHRSRFGDLAGRSSEQSSTDSLLVGASGRG